MGLKPLVYSRGFFILKLLVNLQLVQIDKCLIKKKMKKLIVGIFVLLVSLSWQMAGAVNNITEPEETSIEAPCFELDSVYSDSQVLPLVANKAPEIDKGQNWLLNSYEIKEIAKAKNEKLVNRYLKKAGTARICSLASLLPLTVNTHKGRATIRADGAKHRG